MPIARKKEEQTTEKISLDMLRNAEMVDETAIKPAESQSNDAKPSMEDLNNAETVDETPLISEINFDEYDKIEPDVKVVNDLAETEILEKFKKVQDESDASSLNSLKNKINELNSKNQDILAENSKLKLEIDSVQRSNSESLSSVIALKNRELELTNQINDLRNKFSNLQKDYQTLTDLHKSTLVNASEKSAPKPVIEEKPIQNKKSKVWEPPTHNPYKSFSKKYRG